MNATIRHQMQEGNICFIYLFNFPIGSLGLSMCTCLIVLIIYVPSLTRPHRVRRQCRRTGNQDSGYCKEKQSLRRSRRWRGTGRACEAFPSRKDERRRSAVLATHALVGQGYEWPSREIDALYAVEIHGLNGPDLSFRLATQPVMHARPFGCNNRPGIGD